MADNVAAQTPALGAAPAPAPIVEPMAPATATVAPPPPPSLADPNDNTGGEYLAHRQDLNADGLIAAARQRTASQQPPEQGAQPTILGVTPLPPGSKPPAAPAGSQMMVDGAGNQITYSIDPAGDMKVWSVVKGVAGTAARIAGDILKGTVIEGGAQVAGGATDAVRNLFTAVDHAGNFLNEHVLDLTLPSTGVEAIDNPAKAVGEALPKIPQPETVTGGIIRGVSEFLTGFMPALRVMKGIDTAAGLTGITADIAANTGAGAAASALVLDPQQENLANLIQKIPALKNPVTDFLSAKPDDTEAEGRFKKALEGLALGAVTDGFVQAVKVLRAARIAKGTGAPAVQPEPGIPAKALALGGTDPDAPLVNVGRKTLTPLQVGRKIPAAEAATETGVPSHVAAAGVARPAEEVAAGGEPAPEGKMTVGEPSLMINFDRISTPDDIKKVIADTAEAFAPDIDAARRGVRSNEATKEAADALGMTPADLLARRKGQPLNAEEALAARRLWATSAQKLLEMAKAAADPNAGAIDQFKFRRMLAMHYAIQAEVMGARAETARALQSWSIPAGGDIENARALQQILDNNGGTAVSAMLAQRIAALAKSGVDPAALNTAIRKGAFARTFDAVRELWINGLLSSPTTHITNITSNAVVALQQIFERAVAGQIGTVLGRGAGEGGIIPGEATAMTYGLLAGFQDALRVAWRSTVTGETGQTLGKIENRIPSITAEAAGLSSSTPLGRTIDLIGTTARVPGRLMGAEDEFFKSIVYRMEVNAQAYRLATQEGLQGQAFWDRINQLVNDPPEGIRLAAADQALYVTFNNEPGAWGQAIMGLRTKIPPLGLVLPFVRTPMNIFRYGLERTPFAPMVGQWRADIMAGGARRDLALARIATGTMVMSVAMAYANSGLISGKTPPIDPTLSPEETARQTEALRRQGWQPYSIFKGGKWFSYNRLDPIGLTLGFASDFSQALRKGEMAWDSEDPGQWNQVLSAGIAAVANNAVNKTYLQGLSNLVEMVNDPNRYADNYVQNFLGSFVPFTAGASAVERLVDPTRRETNGFWDYVDSRLPGLSSRLTPMRDVWGKPLAPDEVYGRVFDVLSPVAVTKMKESPIDHEFLKLGWAPTRIAKRTDMAGAKLDLSLFPQAYDDYVRLAGNDLKLPQYENLGAKDFLDRVVTGQSPVWSALYNLQGDGPQGGKVHFIQSVIQDYRKAAAGRVLGDPKNAELLRLWEKRATDQLNMTLPVPLRGAVPPPMLPPTLQ